MQAADMTSGSAIIQKNLASKLLDVNGNNSGNFVVGYPETMFTNENGLTTLISQDYNWFLTTVNGKRICEDYFGDILITQVGDEGNEIWGTTIPLVQNHNSYKHFYNEMEFKKQNPNIFIFNDHPEDYYPRQFVGSNNFNYGGNQYVIYNDYEKNFSIGVGKRRDTVFDFSVTNTVVCKIDKKNNLNKAHLFGLPTKGNYNCTFIESADMDEKRGIYATLVQNKSEGKISMCMSWVNLEK